MRGRRWAIVVMCAGLGAGAGPARAATLEAGVGRADITPPTGYYMMGWVRSDAVARGQHTRLFARAIVLRQGSRKLALVAEDLNGIPGGVLAAAVDRVKAEGFSQENVLDSASHTHAAPSQFYNFPSYDTVFMTAQTPAQQNVSGSIDPQLYEFEVSQLAAAIRKADNDLGPARVGWGSAYLPDLTQNRSLEAHLADFGIYEAYGTGSVAQDPGGQADTIDPNVDVLRVDKQITTTVPLAAGHRRRRHARHRPRRHARPHHQRPTREIAEDSRARRRAGTRVLRRWVPVGMFSTFADHGTVNKATFTYYNADHHGTAMRETEQALRSAGAVPASQDVVNAYGNSDEGDVTAGIAHNGPADAQWVGDREATAMLSAWRDAGAHMTSTPVIDQRWTRLCFCGQQTEGGAVDSKAIFGVPQLTGSEEGRGPLYDLTHVPLEGDTSPVNDPVQGDKIGEAQPPALDVPRAVPLIALRIADRMIVSVPGEMTVEMGRRLRAAVLHATAGSGVTHAVISGLANEYLSYFTTPEEYERQHYEGGSTLYGEYSSNLLMDSLSDLAGRLVGGRPAPDPYPYDPTHGVATGAAAFDQGAPSGSIDSQPGPTPRLGHAMLSWTGGPRGLDRPLGSAFVTIRRRVGASWLPVADDLGLQILWSVDDNGHYRAEWEVPLDAPAGHYEFVVTANRYRLESGGFDVGASQALALRRVGSSGADVALDYPAAVAEQDITYRPASAPTGVLVASVGGHDVTVVGRDGVFHVPSGSGPVSIAAGAARDAHGNSNGAPLQFTP